MERFGLRRVVALALFLVALGSGLTLVMSQAWHLWVLWGLAVGIGMICYWLWVGTAQIPEKPQK